MFDNRLYDKIMLNVFYVISELRDWYSGVRASEPEYERLIQIGLDIYEYSVAGRESPWTCWICRSRRRRGIVMYCFSRWTEACPLPDKTAISVADAFFSNIVCRFGMPSVIHSDQGREFENKVMHELCLLGGSHKTKTTPYHPEGDGLVERFNRTLLMMLAMFAGEHKDDWDYLLPAVMMAYRSSVHESTGFSPYRLMFGEECTLPMDIGLPRRQPDLAEDVTSPYAVWVKDSLEVAVDQVRRHSDQRVVRRLFAIGNWVMRYYPAGKKCKLDSIWTGPYLIVATLGWTVGIQRHPDEPVIFIHCQDVKKIPQPSGVQSWTTIPPPGGTPAVPMLGASTVSHTSWDSPSVTALLPDEGLSSQTWILYGMDDPCCITARVDMQVCLRRVAGGRH